MAGEAAKDRQAQDDYVVVARRYRPQSFQQLIGQDSISRALGNAIESGRIGHAYLFTGARGVGKTSTARILAKCLNCEQGTSAAPCNECDTCQAISHGDDVDVLEIDGASNRGIDEIRQLRSNVNVRPSRSRFKIYIIDEVHMLTKEAFNALLKTLEEPPEHVKFIFCTTEPEKIPITILSRCQRFDFAGINSKSIAQRLAEIASAEGVQVDEAALNLLARRAAGSMRDSQSLLEQLLAFGGDQITVDDVHRLLGTAGDDRLEQLLANIVNQDAAAALAVVDTALTEGVDVGQLLGQLLGYLRDVMVASVGGSPEAMLHASPSGFEQLQQAGKQLGLETLLAMLQVLDQTMARLRTSTYGRTLAEIAMVRLCTLENLSQLGDLINQVRSGTLPENGKRNLGRFGSKLKKNSEPRETGTESASVTGATSPPAEAAPAAKETSQSVSGKEDGETIWRQAVGQLDGLLAEWALQFEAIAIRAPNRLVVHFPAAYNVSRTQCELPENRRRLEQALADVTGREVRIDFAESTPSPAQRTSPRGTNQRQRVKQVSQHQLLQRAAELFNARPIAVQDSPDEADGA